MNDSGGLMFLRYTNASKTYLLRFDICDFDASTFAYTGGGPKIPTESGVGATFAAFAGFWAPYYTADWELSLESLWQTDGAGSKSQLPTVPVTSPVLGSHGPAVVPDPPLRRMYTLRNALGHFWRFNLRDIVATQIGTARTATATSGGFDSRDRMLIGYLSSPATGIVLFDGEAINPSMRVSTRFDVTPYGDTLAGGVVGGGGVTDIDVTFPPFTFTGNPQTQPRQGQSLTLVPQDTHVVPQWQDCCAEGATQPPPAVPSRQRAVRCGAAVAMALTLEQMYEHARSLADADYAGGVVSTISNLVALLGSVISDGLAYPIIALSKPVMTDIVVGFIKAGNLTNYPILSSTQDDVIQQTAFAALPASVNGFSVTPAVMDRWGTLLSTHSSTFHYNQLPLLLQLLQVAPAQAWATIAYVGAQTPSNACRFYPDASGNALQGGAALEWGTRRALSGGGLTDIGRRSMRGGAQLGPFGVSIQGGGYS